MKEASLHPSQVLVNSKGYGSKDTNTSKAVIDNSIDTEPNSANVNSTKKDNNNNNMPVEQLTSHMLSSAANLLPTKLNIVVVSCCYLVNTKKLLLWVVIVSVMLTGSVYYNTQS